MRVFTTFSDMRTLITLRPIRITSALRRFSSSTEKIANESVVRATSATTGDSDVAKAEDTFRPLDIVRSRSARAAGKRRGREKKEVPPPRYLKMDVNQDWGSVWPTARTFHPASVPLPLFQGYVKGNESPPNKFGNLELMKIPNFLHLTPPVVKRQCEALKKFCTPWPEKLDDDVLETLFPIQITTNDYCHSLPSIRDPRARIVTFQVPLTSLNLDYHAKDKFLRLVADRYDSKTDLVSIIADVCPLRQQNFDYAMYLFTAVYHESITKESWEDEKEHIDMETYVWKGSASESSLNSMFPPGSIDPSQLEDYVACVEKLHNDGEDLSSIQSYGDSVRRLFNLPKPI